jgi:hypothetical protein
VGDLQYSREELWPWGASDGRLLPLGYEAYPEL